MNDLVERLSALDTTSVSDSMDRLGIPCALYGIRPVLPGSRVFGDAFTVHYVPCGVVKGTVGDFLDEVKPGQVVVIDNGGRRYCTVWGDIMTAVAKNKHIAGTVIDGVCRDVPGIEKEGYSIFTKGCYVATGKDRVEVDAVNVPVAVSGIQVCPGDYILGDASGVIVIPKDKLAEVVPIAERIEQREQEITELVMRGCSLKEAREKTGYHHFQTKE